MSKWGDSLKADVKFWMSIMLLVVSGTTAFVTLKSDVSATQEKEIEIRRDLESYIKSREKPQEELFNRLWRMERNQQRIMDKFDIPIVELP